MNNNILNNKFFVAFLLFLIITFSFISTSVFASSDNINFKYNDKDYSLPMFSRSNYDSNTDVLIFGYNHKSDFKNFCFVYVKNAKTYINQGYQFICSVNSDGGFSKFYAYRSSDDVTTSNFNYYCLRYTNNVENPWSNWGDCLNEYSDTLWSKFDIIRSDTDLCGDDGKVFFQRTPVTAVEIPALETAKQVPEAMATALKMIIPIGLVVLSILLLIYLMRRLIYRSL